MIRTIWRSTSTVLLVGSLLSANAAIAQDRLIVAFPPGGSTDIVARVIGPSLAGIRGRSIVVENRPGANGVIGLEAMTRSTDGQTFGLMSGSMVLAILAGQPQLLDNLTGVSLLGISGHVVIAPASTSATNVHELVNLAKAGRIQFGSSGSSTMSEICDRQILAASGAQNSNVIAYKGLAPLLNDLLGSQVGAACVPIGAAKSFVSQGKIKAFAVTLPYATDALPGVATLESQNITGVIYGDWLAVVAPKGMSSSTVNSMASSIRQSLGDGNVQNRLQSFSIEPIPSDDANPTIAEQFIRKQAARLAPFAKAQ